jgi:asparagine synthase (glutamine-hydrolysing)
MSRYCGWSTNSSLQLTCETISARISSTLNSDTTGVETRTATKTDCGIVAASANPAVIKYNSHTYIILVDGQPRWQNSKLEIKSEDIGFERTFIENYLENGPDVLNLLIGPFAIALINDTAKETLLAIDRTGIKSQTYTIISGCIVFGSDANCINAHPMAQPELDVQSIYNYFYFHIIPTPGSIYKNYQKLLPGSYVLYRNGEVSLGRYWRLYAHPSKTISNFDQLKQEFVGLLEESVNDAQTDCKSPGTFLSGGTDSSTVTGMLGKVTRKPANSFSIGFDAEGFDEMEYARITAKHFHTSHHEYYVTPDDVVSAIPKIAHAYDQPYGNSSAIPVYYCALLAKNNGIDRLLAGDGGDELFGGNARYAKQKIFSLYDTTPTFIRQNILTPLFLKYAKNLGVFPINKIRSYIEQASIPMPARLESYNLLNRLGSSAILTDDLLEQIQEDYPMNLIDEEYSSCRANNLIDHMLALDVKFTLADNDLPKVTTMCELAGVNVSFPLLDARIIDFSTKLPPDLKLKGTKLRYFFKQALKDFLPAATITKHKQGFGLPFGLWLLNHKPLQELVFDSLESLKSRNIVAPKFLDELRNTHLQNHASYYGTLIWIFVMLEQWFEINPNTENFKL